MDSAPFNFTSAPRRSFLNSGDEPVEDNDMYEWARKNNKLKRIGGSTIIKVADPNAPGGFRYVARNNAETGMTGGLRARGDEARGGPEYDRTFAEGVDQGMPRKVAGDYANDKWTTPGDMASLPTASGDQMGEVIVSSRDRVPSFLSRRAAAPMAADYQKYKDKTAFEEARALRIAEENRVNTNKINLYRKTKEIDKEFAPPGADLAAAAEKARIKALEDAEAERAKKNIRDASKRGSFRTGENIPNLSKRGEDAGRAVLDQTDDVDAAMLAANKAHDADVAEIEKLEASGRPDKIAMAARMRSDPDLAAVRSFIPERNRDFELDAVAKGTDGYFTEFDKAMKDEDNSLFNFSGLGTDGSDPVADLNPDVEKSLATQLQDTVRSLKLQLQQASDTEIKNMILDRARQRKMPADVLQRIQRELFGGSDLLSAQLGAR